MFNQGSVGMLVDLAAEGALSFERRRENDIPGTKAEISNCSPSAMHMNVNSPSSPPARTFEMPAIETPSTAF
jgi:hypothetical protein